MAHSVLLMVLALVFGGGIAFFFLSGKSRQELESSRKQIEQLKSDLQAKSQSKISTESEFKNYAFLWVRLTDLENSINELWHNGVTKSALFRLIAVIEQSDLMLKDSASLLEPSDLAELNRVLTALKDFRAGRDTLTAIRDIGDGGAAQIQRQIAENIALVTFYVKLKITIFRKLRKKLGF